MNNECDKICKHCKQSFTTIRAWQKFCSKDCQIESVKRERELRLIEKICPQCNATFHTPIKKKKFCNYTCREKSIKARRMSPYEVEDITVHTATNKECKIIYWSTKIKDYWEEYGC